MSSGATEAKAPLDAPEPGSTGDCKPSDMVPGNQTGTLQKSSLRADKGSVSSEADAQDQS